MDRVERGLRESKILADRSDTHVTTPDIPSKSKCRTTRPTAMGQCS